MGWVSERSLELNGLLGCGVFQGGLCLLGGGVGGGLCGRVWNSMNSIEYNGIMTL